MARRITRHSSRLSERAQDIIGTDFHANQRVRTIDGLIGRVLFVTESFAPGNTEYQVVLDNGMGGGTYLASQLRPVPEAYGGGHQAPAHLPAGLAPPVASLDGFEAADVHTAADDYPEMGTILHDRPDPGRLSPVVGSRTAAAGPLYHGTRAELKPGDYIEPGHKTNFPDLFGSHATDEGGEPVVYATRSREGAEDFAYRARGHGKPRVYTVEPDMPEDLEDDPEEAVSGPGNSIAPGSVRSRFPLRVIKEGLRRTAVPLPHSQLKLFNTPRQPRPDCPECGYGPGQNSQEDQFLHYKHTSPNYEPDECEHCGGDLNDPEEHSENHQNWLGEQDWYTDWSAESPKETLHRGIGIGLPSPLHEHVHDESRPVHERAHALLSHVLRDQSEGSPHGGLGNYWSDEPDVSKVYAESSTRRYSRHNDQTPVMLHVHTPPMEHIETDPDELQHMGVYSYHLAGNREVPIQNQAPLKIKGISWAKPGHGRLAGAVSGHEVPEHLHEDPAWTHHEFGGEGIRAHAATYADGLDPREDDYNGDPQVGGVYWEAPAQQQFIHDEFGPQQMAGPPMDAFPPAMATTINNQKIDDHGDAPEHGTIPRAEDPLSYDDRSTEGQGDDKWSDPLPGVNKKDVNGAAIGMYPEGMSAGGGPGLEIGGFVASSRDEIGDRWHEYQGRYQPGVLHRGIHVQLPGHLHSYVHNEGVPREERARVLAGHFAESGLGMHWTPHINIAHRAINNAADETEPWDDEENPEYGIDDYMEDHDWHEGRGDDEEHHQPEPTHTDVILHGSTGERNRLRNPQQLEEHGVGWAHSKDEDEFPVKPDSPMRLHGISWKLHEPEYPNEAYEHVDFDHPQRHTAGYVPSWMQREARVPWSPEDRARLYRWQEVPTDSHGDFVSSREFTDAHQHAQHAIMDYLDRAQAAPEEGLQAEADLSGGPQMWQMPGVHPIERPEEDDDRGEDRGVEPSDDREEEVGGYRRFPAGDERDEDEHKDEDEADEEDEEDEEPEEGLEAEGSYHSYDPHQPSHEHEVDGSWESPADPGEHDLTGDYHVIPEDLATPGQHAGTEERRRVMHALSSAHLAASERQWAAHLMRHHGWGMENVERTVERGDRLGDMHSALHDAGMANHDHEGHEPLHRQLMERERQRTRDVAESYGPEFSPHSPGANSFTRPEHGGQYVPDPYRSIMSSEPGVSQDVEDVRNGRYPARKLSSLDEFTGRQRAPADEVYAQLAKDYPPDALDWVHDVEWSGPHSIPLKEVDWEGKDTWNAASEPGRVKKFRKKIEKKEDDGDHAKPAVLVSRPGKPTQMVADGHHRALAYEELDRPVWAYTAHAPAETGPWDEMHSHQFGKEGGGEGHGGADEFAFESQDGVQQPAAPAKKLPAMSQGGTPSGQKQPPRAADDPSISPDGKKKLDKAAALKMFRLAATDPAYRFEFTASWQTVVAKAKAIREAGGVRVTAVHGQSVLGSVRGDHGTYECGIQSWPGRPQSLAFWTCACDWAQHKQDLAAGWAGRPCSHAMALSYEARSRRMFGQELRPDPPGDPFTRAAAFGTDPSRWNEWNQHARGGYHNPHLDPYDNDGEAARQSLGIDGTMGDAQDVPHAHQGEGAACAACGLNRDYHGQMWGPAAQLAREALLAAGEDSQDVDVLCITAGMAGLEAAGDSRWKDTYDPEDVFNTADDEWGGLDKPPGTHSTRSDLFEEPGRLTGHEPQEQTRTTGHPFHTWSTVHDAAANDPFGGENTIAHPPSKPYGATEQPNLWESPASYGPLSGPDPENWGEISDMSATQTNNITSQEAALHQASPQNQGVHLTPYLNNPQSPASMGQERQDSFPYEANTGGPYDAMAPADPEGMQMGGSLAEPQLPGGLDAEKHGEPEPALDPEGLTGDVQQQPGGQDASASDTPDRAALSSWGALDRYRAMFGAARPPAPYADSQAGAHIPATPSYPLDAAATGGGPGMSPHDEDLSPGDMSIQTMGNQQWSGGGADSDEVVVEPGQPQGSSEHDIVAAFQRSAAARQFTGGGGAVADGDIAGAARAFLSKTADVLPDAEAQELIREGRGVRARNLGLLDLEGTHYAEEQNELERRGLNLDNFEDDVVSF